MLLKLLMLKIPSSGLRIDSLLMKFKIALCKSMTVVDFTYSLTNNCTAMTFKYFKPYIS